MKNIKIESIDLRRLAGILHRQAVHAKNPEN